MTEKFKPEVGDVWLNLQGKKLSILPDCVLKPRTSLFS